MPGRGLGGGLGGGWAATTHSHIKGLTVLWMCLCCLRPEEVAKVFPQSGQAWARAPTCWERMCRCRLLGSVNTWGHRHWHVTSCRSLPVDSGSGHGMGVSLGTLSTALSLAGRVSAGAMTRRVALGDCQASLDSGASIIIPERPVALRVPQAGAQMLS